MKPRNFKLNSDYLTIANVENKSYTISVPAGTVPAGGSYTLEYTLQCRAISQAITRTYIHHSSWDNPNLWGVGTFGVVGWKNNDTNQDIFEYIMVSTPTDSTIKVSLELHDYDGTGATVPEHTIKLKAFRFKVPNVF